MRIEECGGRIEPFRFGGISIGPTRLWLKDEDMPGLSMTRAFGDSVGVSAGMISDPHIETVNLKRKNIEYIVMGTSSAFKVLSNQELMAMAFNSESAKSACQQLVTLIYHSFL